MTLNPKKKLIKTNKKYSNYGKNLKIIHQGGLSISEYIKIKCTKCLFQWKNVTIFATQYGADSE